MTDQQHQQPANQPNSPALRGLNQEQLRELLVTNGFESYRAKQIYQWIFRKGVREISEMRNLPRKLAQWLSEHTRLATLAPVRVTGDPNATAKLLFKLDDGKLVESVLMHDEQADDERTSICLSSQVGCAVGCAFCLTGFGGFQRNLSVDEIVGQAIDVRNAIPGEDKHIDHLVMMGMGEPMLNLDNLIPALRLLTDPDGFGLSRRRLTVSSAGIVPGIQRFGEAGVDAGLAISLNATTDAVRDEIMPINKKWPIEQLLETCRNFPLDPRRRITFEYVLLKGINDTPEDARRLVHLLRGIKCKVNLIMFNPSPHLPYAPVEPEMLNMFARTLSEAHMTITVRWSKGREIEAACGQLAAHYFEQEHA